MRKAVFLDRDGVINKPKKGGYITDVSELEILPGVAEAIKQFNKSGYLVFIVTNQLGVSLGKIKKEDLKSIHMKILSHLNAAGTYIQEIIACPNMSSFRKPALGMFVDAVRRWDIDISQSIMIGDTLSDMMAAESLGCKKAFIISELSPPIYNSLLDAAKNITELSIEAVTE